MTLVELLVVVLSAGIIAVAILTVLMTSSSAFSAQSVRIQNQDSARLSINQMTRYLRAATSSVDNQSSQSNSLVTTLGADIEFYCDIDGDGLAEKVRYYLDGTDLRMQTAKPQFVTIPEPHWVYPTYESNGIIVQDGLRNGSTPVFTYYRRAGESLQQFTPSTAVQRRQVENVRLHLIVNERPDVVKGNVELTTEVQLRQRYGGGLK